MLESITLTATPLRHWEKDLNPDDMDDGRHGRTYCIEDDRQVRVNVSENHLASLEPEANVQNDEISESSSTKHK